MAAIMYNIREQSGFPTILHDRWSGTFRATLLVSSFRGCPDLTANSSFRFSQVLYNPNCITCLDQTLQLLRDESNVQRVPKRYGHARGDSQVVPLYSE